MGNGEDIEFLIYGLQLKNRVIIYLKNVKLNESKFTIVIIHEFILSRCCAYST